MKTIYILTAIIFCATIFAEENVSKQKIPMPPWTETTGAPTSSFQALDYLFQVLPLMSENTRQDLCEALDRDASAGELLAIIYSENLNRHLIDYNNPDNEETSGFNALVDLMNTLKLYESQWQHHFGDFGNFWSLGSGNSNSLTYMIKQIMDFEELAQRIQDPTDMLEDINKYENVLDLPGAAYSILVWGCHLLELGTYPRSRPILKFLTLENNKNLFVKGGAHFWYGYVLYKYYNKYDKALEYFYVVHTYPACLVNIDWSYILTAKIFLERGKTNTALALLSIRIPTMDHKIEEIRKANMSIKILCEQNNLTDAALQVARGLIAGQNSANQNIVLYENYARNKICTKYPDVGYESFLQAVATSNCYENYEIKVIRQALIGSEQAKNNTLVMDMLLHAWPLIEEVDSSVLTNRMLCNNIFGQERRTDIILE